MSVTVDELLTHDPSVTIINAGKHQGKREVLGAIHYRPSDLLEAEHLALPIAHESPVILYTEDGDSKLLETIAAKLRGDGFSDVRIYEGALADYELAGGATQEPSMEQVVPPSEPDEVRKLDRRI
jgi:hypothetical protein